MHRTLPLLLQPVRNILGKLDAESRAEAIVTGLRLGLVELGEIMISSDREIPMRHTLPMVINPCRPRAPQIAAHVQESARG